MKFKVGDRVKVYGGIHNVGGDLDGAKGTVVEIFADLKPIGIEFDVAVEKNTFWCVYPQQCRLLKRKAPRSAWLPIKWENSDSREFEEDGPAWLYRKPDPELIHTFVEFVEVKKK